MNENNMNQTPNTENGYPQSEYPQSGYPQSQQPFPQSDMPYPMSGYAEEKKSKTWQIAIISIVAVLIIALATTLIVVLQKKNQQQGMGMMPPPPPPMGTFISISENGSTINGQPATIAFYTENGMAYLKLEDISSTAGYDFVREGNQIKLLSQMELAILEVGSTKVTLQDQTSKSTTSVEILKAPFDKDGDLYIYARDLSVFMKNTNVSYNSMTSAIEITINAGMGGPGGPPPMGGQPPQGGMPPQGAQPPQGEQEQQKEKATDKTEKATETEKKTENSKTETSKPAAAPQGGGQPPQGAPAGQPPKGGPGGPPPQGGPGGPPPQN